MTRVRSRTLLLGVLCAAAVPLGCGDDGDKGSRSTDSRSGTQGERRAPRPSEVAPPPEPAPGAPAAPAEASRVIRAWADALRRSDIDAAADLFAVPSLLQFAVTAPAVRATKASQVRGFNRLFPCGARFVRAVTSARFAVATFRLTDRPGAQCDGPGSTARAAFVIRGGKITEWRRVPDTPSDPGNPPPGAPENEPTDEAPLV